MPLVVVLRHSDFRLTILSCCCESNSSHISTGGWPGPTHGTLELLYEVPQSLEDHLDQSDWETVEPGESRYLSVRGRHRLESLRCAVLVLSPERGREPRSSGQLCRGGR